MSHAPSVIHGQWLTGGGWDWGASASDPWQLIDVHAPEEEREAEREEGIYGCTLLTRLSSSLAQIMIK